MFAGQKICGHCQTPQSPESYSDGSEVCSVCVRKMDLKMARVEVAHQTTGDVITESLRELRNKEAATPAAAEAFLSQIGGAEGFGSRLASDFMEIRGEGLTESQKKAHVVSHSHLVSLYKLGAGLMGERDRMVSETDPLTDIEGDELNAIVAEGASLRIQADAEFRETLLRQILDIDPSLIIRVANDLPFVEVIGG